MEGNSMTIATIQSALDATNFARTVPLQSPVAQVAYAVCMTRHLDPYGWAPGSGLQNWQAIVAEAGMMMLLEQELKLMLGGIER
jgi:hypothetical protein